MVTPSVGAVVLIPFPFSDLTQSKMRPAVVLADAGHDDWILCQVTSKPYSDPGAIQIDQISFASGSLRVTSYARPGKLFTANQSLMANQVGTLTTEPLEKIIETVVKMLRAGTKFR
ncbi:MAG: type II toxin-antitoxin system PemK/MazF family toxin [Chloroflexi bacterium]|nr:type II toxin-antitoxin system PemK/MazF family toxin [Chloroflexota bacterium]